MNRQHTQKLIVLALLGLSFGLGVVKLSDYLSLDYLATQEESLRSFQKEHAVLSYAIALGIYVAVTGLSIPGATVLTVTYAWFFGLVPAVIISSFASTTGATIAFLLSRYLFRDSIERRSGERLTQFDRALERDGHFYLLSLRLIPVVPFFVINVVMGLTSLSVTTFWWISQLGMLPATIVYAYAGTSVPTLAELAERGTSSILNFQVFLALVLLGVFPLVVRALVSRFIPVRNGDAADV